MIKLLCDIDEVNSLQSKLKYSLPIKGRKDYDLIFDSLLYLESDYGFLEIHGDRYIFRFTAESDLAYFKLTYPDKFSEVIGES